MKRFASILCIWLTLCAPCWAADMVVVVDTALSEVPVNKVPLLDDTDFKSIEGAVAYNASGMALRWHFVDTTGAYTVTSVTPTTAGVYDWTDQGDSGVYTIEIPASGGGSINNDTEGVGWFTGVATGVLPWTGPTIQFSPANIPNSLVNGSDNLDVNAQEWNDLATVALPLIPTTAGRALDVSTGGEAGLDWANIGSPTATVGLSGTTIGVLTTYTGNTPQTGDNFAIVNSGTHGNAAIKGYVDDIGAAGVGLTAVPWNAAWDVEAQSEAQDAITASFTLTNGQVTALNASAGRVWYVDDTDGSGDTGTREAPFDTYAAAESAASFGDTIHILAGSYGFISITKAGLTVQGDGDATIVDTSNVSDGPSINVGASADYTTLRNLQCTVSGSGSVCIAVAQSGGTNSNCGTTIENVTATGSADALTLSISRGTTVRNCRLSSAFDVIACGGSTGFLIEQCRLAVTVTDTTTSRAIYAPATLSNGPVGIIRNCSFVTSRTGAGSNDTLGIHHEIGANGNGHLTVDSCVLAISCSNGSYTGTLAGIGSVTSASTAPSVSLSRTRIITTNSGSGSTYDIDAGVTGSKLRVAQCAYSSAKLNGAANIQGLDDNVADILVDTGITLDDLVDGVEASLADGTTGLPAIKTAVDGVSAGTSPNLLQTTTITGLSSQTVFNLTAGSADNDAYNNQLAVIVDASTAVQKASIAISDYVGSTKTITLAATPIFTIANGDTIHIIAAPPATVSGTVDANLVQMGGSTQSATDLKDFADTGYDPATDKANAQVKGLDANTLTAAAAASDLTTELQTGLFLDATWDTFTDAAPTFGEAMDDQGYTAALAETLEENVDAKVSEAGGGDSSWQSDEVLQVLAALSVQGDIGIPKALIWTVSRKDGNVGSSVPIVIDPDDDVPVACKFNNVLAVGDAIDDIVSVELVGGGAGSVESPAFDDVDDAELWMASAVKFNITEGTSGTRDQIKVKVHTVGGSTISANVYVLPSNQ